MFPIDEILMAHEILSTEEILFCFVFVFFLCFVLFFFFFTPFFFSRFLFLILLLGMSYFDLFEDFLSFKVLSGSKSPQLSSL